MRVKVRTHHVLFPKQKQVFNLLENDPRVEEVYFGGAAGPGKSTLGCFWQIYRRCKYPGTIGLIGRANFTDLEETTVKTFWRVWEQVGKRNPFGVTVKRVGNRILFSNDSEILLRWVRDRGGSQDENYGFGSLDLTDFFLDEVTEIPEKVYEILSSRVRFRLIKGKPAMLSVSNPAQNWVKYRYIEDENGHPAKLKTHQAVILATLSDNKDKDFRMAYASRLNKLSPADRARLLGAWDYSSNENPFFHSFREDLVDGYKYKLFKYEPLILSFDFNVNPCTVVVAQKTDDYGVLVHACHQAKGGTHALMEKIKPFGYIDHPGGLIVTGDVSGRAAHSSSARTEFGDLQTDYGIIKEALMLGNRNIIHTAHQNARHTFSRRVCNHAFFMGVVRFSEPGTRGLVQEIRDAIPDKAGNLFKDRAKGHPNDRVDAYRYLNSLCFPEGFKSINILADLMGIGELPGEPDSDHRTNGFDSLKEFEQGK